MGPGVAYCCEDILNPGSGVIRFDCSLDEFVPSNDLVYSDTDTVH